MSTMEVIRQTASWKPTSYLRLAGEFELQRRRDRAANVRGWIALAISVVSLAVAIGAFVLRK